MAAAGLARHLPTPDERLLLRAACLPDERAAEAWQEWLRRNDLQDTDKTSFELLAAVYRNLNGLGAATPPLLRGIYNRSWVNNQKLFQSVAAVLRIFAEHAIPVLLLKGGALSTRYYHDSGTRPTYGVDVLVPAETAQAAYDLLRANGWKPLITPGGPMAHVVCVVRSCEMRAADGTNLDLHWHAMVDRYGPRADGDFWDGAVEQVFNRVPALTLCAPDLLLHVIVHGSKWESTRSVVWLMDAYRIIASAGERFDWQRLAVQARQRSAVLPVTVALDYLRRELGAPVPEATTLSLRRRRLSFMERLGYRAEGTGDSFFAMAFRHILGHLRRTQGRSPLYRLHSWVWYLQASWGVPSGSQLTVHAARRLLNRLQYSSLISPGPNMRRSNARRDA
jgi:hypothetical protein